MAMDCHLLYKPIGRSCTLSSLDYVQPISLVSLASTTTALPSAPAIIEDNEIVDILPTYAGHWPMRPKLPPSPSYDLSLIPPLHLQSASKIFHGNSLSSNFTLSTWVWTLWILHKQWSCHLPHQGNLHLLLTSHPTPI